MVDKSPSCHRRSWALHEYSWENNYMYDYDWKRKGKDIVHHCNKVTQIFILFNGRRRGKAHAQCSNNVQSLCYLYCVCNSDGAYAAL